MRVLFLDDSPLARARTTRLMHARGLEVAVCSTLAEAGSVDPSSVQAALLDLEVGDEHGTDAARALREAAPELPIAFLTAATDGDLVALARSFGPVFDKLSELEKAVVWLTSLV